MLHGHVRLSEANMPLMDILQRDGLSGRYAQHQTEIILADLKMKLLFLFRGAVCKGMRLVITKPDPTRAVLTK